MTDAVKIRPAATLVLWRTGALGPEVLMGQRGATAAFMPSKFVFPGGAVEAGDRVRTDHLTTICAARLAEDVPPEAPLPDQIAAAALRELAEETGLRLQDAAPMRFIFRAITPPGSPRRYDARFLMGSAEAILGDPDDFAAAEDELAALQWVPLQRARSFDLPFITEIVLSEISAILHGKDQPGVPFFDNSGPVPAFRRLD